MSKLLEELVDSVPFCRWPKHIAMKSMDGLSDIYYAECFWKLVDRTAILDDIAGRGELSPFYSLKASLENCKKDTLIAGYNPLELEAGVKLGCTATATDGMIRELENLNAVYEARVKKALICEAGTWCSLGSELEVDEAAAASRREKISVEWIGVLEKRVENWSLKDIEAEDLTNGYVEFMPDRDVVYEIRPITRLDVGVQVYVKKKVATTQTDVRRICEEFLSIIPDDTRFGSQETEQLPLELASSGVDEQIQPDANLSMVDDDNLHYFKSFVNIEHRCKMISSVAWHPTRMGFVAVAYYESVAIDTDKFVVENETPFVRSKRVPMNEHDLKINKAVFDLLSQDKGAERWQEIDDAVKGLGEDEDDVENEAKSHLKINVDDDIRNLLVYHRKRRESQMGATLSSHSSRINDLPRIDSAWITDILASCEKRTDVVDVEVMCADETADFTSDDGSLEESTDSDTSFTARPVDAPPNLRLPDDVPSEDSEDVEDYLQIDDTDSSVLVWSCDNDLYPYMKLYNVHDINTIKFHPCNGDLLAGGSISGQLVLWDLQNEFDKPEPRRAIDDSEIISEFMENLPQWEATNKKYPTLHPVSVSERNNSHVDRVTCIEWLHPSVKASKTGLLAKQDSRDYARQILTSSMDGNIKIWNTKRTHPMTSDQSEFSDSEGIEPRWSIELIYTLTVANLQAEKYPTPIRFFQMFWPSVRYTSTSTSYECVYEKDIKFHQILTVANEIGEVGVIRWTGKEEDGAENCKHEWWGTCHDATITSLSRNYYFPSIVLATGGRIFSLWSTEYKGGPIWWQQYEDMTISQGCFTPFHPGVVYIGKSDGRIDIWDVGKQVHRPVTQFKATGFSISVLSVVTPPSSQYQISIADSNGNFHILKNKYDMTWNAKDYSVIGRFFRQAVESRRQLQSWNRTWRERSTATDMYGFEHKSLPKRTGMPRERVRGVKINGQSLMNETKMPENSETFTEKLVQTEEYKTKLRDALDNLKYLKKECFEKFEQEILANVQDTSMDEQSVDDIIDKYCT